MNPETPNTVLWDGERIAAAKARTAATPAPAQKLRSEAEEALDEGPFSVVDKKILPPSGDPQDYHSRAGYYWPNPDTEDGLPWVCRDGESNPTAADTDRSRLAAMAKAVETLSLAAYFFDDTRYSNRARELLTTWFLAPDTRMNPHLEYAQSIPGVWDGSGWGIVDTRHLVPVADSVALLTHIGALSAVDQDRLNGWFATYVLWLRESDNGRMEAMRPNNHATAYDLQVSVLSAVARQDYVARKVLQDVPEKRIDFQLEQTGKQMWEIARTSALGYSVGNIELLISLGVVGRHYGIDLLGYASLDGRSIRRSLDFLIPFVTGKEEWRWERHNFEAAAGNRFAGLLSFAAYAFAEPAYREIIPQLIGFDEAEFRSDRVHLLYPE